MLGIPILNHQQLKLLIKHKYKTKTPLFIWGTFGIGKSYIVREAGKELADELRLEYSNSPKDINDETKFIVLTIPLHQYDISELKGIGVPDREKKVTEFLPTNLLPQAGQGIIFFDELNLAPSLVQANAYQLILDRQLGNYKVPEGYYVIGAGNIITDKAHVMEMAMPLKNRFTHVQLKIPTSEEWIKNFALKVNIDKRIINFIAFRDDLLYKYNPDSDEELIAVATPRSWEFTSRDIKDIEDEELLEILVGGACGIGIAREFIAWLKLSKSYDVAEIYKKEKLDRIPNEVSELYALINALVSYYLKNPSKENAVKLFKFAQLFSPEHTILMLSQVCREDKEFIKKIKEVDLTLFKEFAKKYLKFLI